MSDELIPSLLSGLRAAEPCVLNYEYCFELAQMTPTRSHLGDVIMLVEPGSKNILFLVLPGFDVKSFDMVARFYREESEWRFLVASIIFFLQSGYYQLGPRKFNLILVGGKNHMFLVALGSQRKESSIFSNFLGKKKTYYFVESRFYQFEREHNYCFY